MCDGRIFVLLIIDDHYSDLLSTSNDKQRESLEKFDDYHNNLDVYVGDFVCTTFLTLF